MRRRLTKRKSVCPHRPGQLFCIGPVSASQVCGAGANAQVRYVCSDAWYRQVRYVCSSVQCRCSSKVHVLRCMVQMLSHVCRRYRCVVQTVTCPRWGCGPWRHSEGWGQGPAPAGRRGWWAEGLGARPPESGAGCPSVRVGGTCGSREPRPATRGQHRRSQEGRWPGTAAPPDAAQQSAFHICPPCLAPAVPRPPSRRDGRQHRGAAGHGAGQPRGRCSARSLCPIPWPPRPRPPLPVPWPWLRHLLSAPSLRGAAGLAPNVPYREEPETLGSSPTSQREIVPE